MAANQASDARHGDDWRVTIALEEPGRLSFLRRLSEAHVASALRKQLDPGVIVTHGDAHIYVYAASEVAARATEELARITLAAANTEAELAVHRWHPIEQEWEKPEIPLPQTPAEEAAEHAKQQADEAATAEASGHTEWEVLVELPSHADAVETADRIEALALPLVRRWRYVIVGTATEDEAKELAEQLTIELTSKVKISVRPSGGMLLEVLPSSPFLVFARLRSHVRET